MKRIVLADIKSNNNKGVSTGHYFALAQNYLDVFGKECNCIIAGGPIYKSKFKKVLTLPHDSIEGDSLLVNKYRVLANCYYLFKNTGKDDVVVLQHSGTLTFFLGIIFFANRNNNIYIIQYDTTSLSSKVKRLIYKLAKNRIKGILCPNASIGEAYDKEYCVIPDYIFAKKAQNDEWCDNNKKYDFAIVGSIFPDKGVAEVANFFRNKDYKILIAGKAYENLENTLKKLSANSPNIDLRLGYLSENDYYNYFREARYCILNYRGVYQERSSGVVLDALYNGVPVVGHDCKALNFIKEENVGFLFDDIENLNPDALLNETKYRSYLHNINTFISKQSLYKNKIMDFLRL